MFRLIEVGKGYPGVRALSDVSLTIQPGETVALIGPSGSGKSTLLNLLARVLLPDAGRLEIDGRPSAELRPGAELSSLVGIMAQRFDLVESLPVVHNVLAGRLGRWGLAKSLISLIIPQELPLARSALNRVGIPHKLYERTSHLSGGEQQRVALARLLVQRPRAVLADEPVASLDPARAEDLVAMLVSIAKEEGLTSSPACIRCRSPWATSPALSPCREGRLFFDRPASE